MTATASSLAPFEPRVLIFGPLGLGRELGELLTGEGLRFGAEPPELRDVRATDMIVLDLTYGGPVALERLAYWRGLPEDERPAVLSLYSDPAHRPQALSVGDAIRVPCDPAEFKDRVVGLVRWHASWRRAVVATRKLDEARALLRDAEDRLSKLEARNQARQKNDVEVTAYLAHEIKTPLNAILGFSELMASTALAPKLAHKAAEYATDIHTAGSHLLQLINDLLDLSKAEAGKMELVESEVEIGGIVERVLRLVEGHARDGGVMIATAVPAMLPRLRADDRKILQMVLNLVANAVKFTPSGGKVTIAATISSDGDLRLTVVDTGVGIAAKSMPRVLVPFAQVDNDITRRTSGTGLGLPIAKQFADLHGGSLSIESVENQGTTVTVRLPGERLIDLEPEELRRVG